ncbi:hypothetical protein [Bradyrhizobium zhanjiangense]|nr:hypothetical protein [Bradyrhizobium zhanjiangense]
MERNDPFSLCSASVVIGMAPIFRLQEEEPQLLTDAEQQEHRGNEAARRVLFRPLQNYSNCAWQYDCRVIGTSTNIYKFIEAPRAARCPSVLRL